MLSPVFFRVAGEALHPPDGSEERTIRRQRQLLAHQQARECAVGVEQGAQLVHESKSAFHLTAYFGSLAWQPSALCLLFSLNMTTIVVFQSMQVKEVKVSAQAMLPSSSVITFTLGALSKLPGQ
jgi:hypothetical protein